MKPKVLLHVCCGPCSTAVIERLKPDYDILAYFYNPNISPFREYALRLDSFYKVVNSDILRVKYIAEEYSFEQYVEEHKKWVQFISKIGNPLDFEEGSERCNQCFYYRLEHAAIKAKELGISMLATSLSIGPMKHVDEINRIGLGIGKKYGLKFLDINFRKKGGWNRSIELSKALNLYRQDYCGCEFSKVERILWERNKQKNQNKKD